MWVRVSVRVRASVSVTYALKSSSSAGGDSQDGPNTEEVVDGVTDMTYTFACVFAVGMGVMQIQYD